MRRCIRSWWLGSVVGVAVLAVTCLGLPTFGEEGGGEGGGGEGGGKVLPTLGAGGGGEGGGGEGGGKVLPARGEGGEGEGGGNAASKGSANSVVGELWIITAVDVTTNSITGTRDSDGTVKTLKINGLTMIKTNDAPAKLEDVKVGMEAYFVMSLDPSVAAQILAHDAGTAAKAGTAGKAGKGKGKGGKGKGGGKKGAGGGGGGGGG